MSTLDFQTVLDAVERTMSYDDLREVIRLDYSGRYMYGKECFGLVVDTVTDLTLVLHYIFREITEDQAEDLAANVRQDSMGMSTIYYFPDWTLDNVPAWMREDEFA